MKRGFVDLGPLKDKNPQLWGIMRVAAIMRHACLVYPFYPGGIFNIFAKLDMDKHMKIVDSVYNEDDINT